MGKALVLLGVGVAAFSVAVLKVASRPESGSPPAGEARATDSRGQAEEVRGALPGDNHDHGAPAVRQPLQAAVSPHRVHGSEPAGDEAVGEALPEDLEGTGACDRPDPRQVVALTKELRGWVDEQALSVDVQAPAPNSGRLEPFSFLDDVARELVCQGTSLAKLDPDDLTAVLVSVKEHYWFQKNVHEQDLFEALASEDPENHPAMRRWRDSEHAYQLFVRDQVAWLAGEVRAAKGDPDRPAGR